MTMTNEQLGKAVEGLYRRLGNLEDRFEAIAPIEQQEDVGGIGVYRPHRLSDSSLIRDVIDAWRSGEKPGDYGELINEAIRRFGG